MQTLFGQHLTENPPKNTEVYELKICKGSSLPFNAVKEHQIKGLQESQTGLYHKLTDFPMFAGSKMRFNRPKPFDCVAFNNAIGYVVVWFYQPRQKKIFHKIKIDDYLQLRDSTNRKSFNEAMLQGISEQIMI